jgi:serine/threonine protein kinase
MLLAPGTTLQNDQYVIDALLEDAENGALYWGTQVATGNPVYLQRGMSLTAVDGSSTACWDSTRLEASSACCAGPCCTGIMETFIDGQHLYLVMTTAVGQPWSHRHRYSGPLPPQQALIRVQQVATGLLWLMDQGIVAVDLAPNRVWWPDADAAAILTGWFGAEPPNATGSPSPAPFNPLPALAALLEQFLAGCGPRTPDRISALGQDAKISPRVIEAIQLGLEASPPPRSELASTVTGWLQSLQRPDGQGAPAQSPLTTPPLTSPQPIHSSPQAFYRPSPGFALTLTALVAALTGLGFGMAWRLNLGPQPPGGPRFSPDQGFPALSNWAGETPVDTIERTRDRWQPSQFPDESQRVNPDYLEGIPERWTSPVTPWETFTDRPVPAEEGPRLPAVAPRPAPAQPNNPLQENPQPEPTMTAPTAPNASPVKPPSPPAEVAPAPAPAPDLSTAES